jgi:hypothetical protein
VPTVGSGGQFSSAVLERCRGDGPSETEQRCANTMSAPGPQWRTLIRAAVGTVGRPSESAQRLDCLPRRARRLTSPGGGASVRHSHGMIAVDLMGPGTRAEVPGGDDDPTGAAAIVEVKTASAVIEPPQK